MKNSINSKVFKVAHQIQSFCQSWSEAVRKAWFLIKLELEQKEFVFAKKDDTERVATGKAINVLGTAQKGFIRFIENKNGAEQFRSFRIERLVYFS